MTSGRIERRTPQVVDARYVQPARVGQWDTMIDTRSALLARLRRGAKRREYGRVGEMSSMGGGLWRVEVWRLRPEPPAWRRPAVIAGSVLAAIGALLGLGWWAVSATVGAAGSALAGKGDAVLAGIVMIVVGGLVLALRRPIVEVIVKVR